MDFLLDMNNDPESEVYEVVGGGALGDTMETRGKPDAVIREKQAGVIMSANNAFSVGTWILSRLLQDASEEKIRQVLLEYFEPVDLQPQSDEGGTIK